MGTENFNRQFILLDFRDLDNPEYLAFVRAPEFSTYLLMRRHVWRSSKPHHMGLNDLYGRDRLLACSLDRERMAQQLGGVSTRTVSNDLVALERRGLIRVQATGRQNIYVLGWWGEEDGVYYEAFYADRLQVRGEEDFTSEMKRRKLQGRPEASFTSALNLADTPERQGSSSNNREEKKEQKREDVEVSKRQLGEVIEARTVLHEYVEDLARELRDEAPISVSVTRLLNLYVKSGLPLEDFVARMMAARLTTQKRTGAITKRAAQAEGMIGTKNKMPYFFGVLDDLIGAG